MPILDYGAQCRCSSVVQGYIQRTVEHLSLTGSVLAIELLNSYPHPPKWRYLPYCHVLYCTVLYCTVIAHTHYTAHFIHSFIHSLCQALIKCLSSISWDFLLVYVCILVRTSYQCNFKTFQLKTRTKPPHVIKLTCHEIVLTVFTFSWCYFFLFRF